LSENLVVIVNYVPKIFARLPFRQILEQLVLNPEIFIEIFPTFFLAVGFDFTTHPDAENYHYDQGDGNEVHPLVGLILDHELLELAHES